MSNRPILPGTRSAISLPGLQDGPSHSESQGWPTPRESGPEARPVSHSPSRERVVGAMTNGTLPPNLRLWLGPSAPDCCLANKSQARRCSERFQDRVNAAAPSHLNGLGSMIYRIAWKPHTTPLGRSIYRQRASGHRTSANGHFSAPTIYDLPQVGWPTPNASNVKNAYQDPDKVIARKEAGRQSNLQDFAALAGWNTTRATDGSNGGPNQKGAALSADAALAGWGTPVAHEARLGYQNRRNGKKGTQKSLTTECVDFLDPTRGDPELAGWPTATAVDRYSDENTMKKRLDARKKRGRSTVPLYLGDPELAGWPTPVSNDDNKTPEAHLAMKQRMGERDGTGSNRTTITSLQVMAKFTAPARLTTRGELLTGCSAGMESGGQLNPEHSRWLMGFPIEWGFCGAMAMRSIRGRRRKQSKSSPKQ